MNEYIILLNKSTVYSLSIVDADGREWFFVLHDVEYDVERVIFRQEWEYRTVFMSKADVIWFKHYIEKNRSFITEEKLRDRKVRIVKVIKRRYGIY